MIPTGIVEQIEDRERGGALDEVRLERIRANPDQPRRTFDEEKLRELAESIRSSGVLQPLLVRSAGDGYELIAGERRFRAARLAGIETVPVVVHDVSDKDALRISLVENIQRDDLNPIEEAHGYRRLMEEFGITQRELGETLGKDRSTIANGLRLLKLSPGIQRLVVEGRLSGGHARALLAVDDEAKREGLASRAAEMGLSVRELEELVAPPSPRPASRKRGATLDHDLLGVQEMMERHLGTRVRVSPRGEGGAITIRFENRRDLERLAETMGIRFKDF